MTHATTLLAADIGNSRIKLGRFDEVGSCESPAPRGALPIAPPPLPEPQAELRLPLARDAKFDAAGLVDWIDHEQLGRATWWLASVNRTAAGAFVECLVELGASSGRWFEFHTMDYRDVPLRVAVDQPAQVGIDRLLAALAANRLRSSGQPAIVVDHGSAITIDLLDATGSFAGGAILPGMAMAARALAEQTDALPQLDVPAIADAPPPVGKSTIAALESGLHWGTVGAVRETIRQMQHGLPAAADVFVTGGAARRLADELSQGAAWPVRHVPHLVLAGIALAWRHAQEQP